MLSGLAACAGSLNENEPVEELRILLPRPPGDPRAPMSSFAVWQGWSMRWGYNHRLNRAGGLVEQLPCTDDAIRSGRSCRARMTLAAASGSGPDRAQVENHVALVAARRVQAVSAAREFVLRGLEGERLSVQGDVRVPTGEGWLGLPEMVPLLSGFDVGSLGSADKLIHLAVKLGEPTAEGSDLFVPVSIDATLSCDSGECPPMDRVDVSFLIGVTVLASTERAMKAERIRATRSYDWEKKEPVPDEALTVDVPPPPESEALHVFAVRDFEVTLDQELHLLEFGLLVEPETGKLETELRTWRPGMRNSRRPYSFFSYAHPGAATWNVDLWRLDFTEAVMIRQSWTSEVDWRPRGRHAFDPLAEQTRMIEWKVQP